MNGSKQQIIDKAKSLGFDFVGFSKAEKLTDHETYLTDWLKHERQAKMAYMSNHQEKRLDPSLLVPGAKTVVSLLYNYYPENDQPSSQKPKVSRYAYGTDYHFVIKNKLKQLFQYINEEVHPIKGRVFVDSAPVLERAWAAKSGLGWVGKNSMLINKQMGSYFFISELIIDLEIDPDSAIKDFCGSCTACIDECPTDAIIVSKRTIDSNKCISNWTIENKTDEIPEEISQKLEGWAFGCDICQEVCPWNRFSQPHNETEFNTINWEEINLEKLTNGEAEGFNSTFKHSPLKRAGKKGIKRNIEYLKH